MDACSGRLIRAILGNVHEQAWKDHLWSLAAALLNAILSILRECSIVAPHVRTIEVLALNNCFPLPTSLSL